MTRRVLISMVGVLVASCSYTVPDPVDAGIIMAKCRVDAFNAFCVVAAPPGTQVVGGAPVAVGAAAALGGIGNMGAGFGVVLSGIKAAR